MDNGDFYQNLREKIRNWLESDEGRSSKWAEYIMLVPDMLHLLVKLMADPDVPVKEKAKIGAALAYFVSPVDLVPEALIGPTNYLDDMALAAYVIKGIVNNANEDVVRRNWAGERDILEIVQGALNTADAMLGVSVWNRLRKVVG